MINGIEDLAFLAGIVMGSILLLAVSWVWIRKQVLGAGGVTMSFVGVTLVGLTVWSSVRIQASPDGLLAEFDRRLESLTETVEEVDSNLQEVVETNISFSRDIESLASSVNTNGQQFVTLTRELQTAGALNAAPLNDLRQNIQTPAIRTDDLRIRREALQTIRRN